MPTHSIQSKKITVQNDRVLEPVKKGNFLNRCVEQLNLEEAKSHQRTATMWKVAAQVAPWMFAIIAVGAFVSTGIFAAAYLPVAGVAVLLFLEPVYNFCNRIEEFSKEPQARARMLTEVKKIHDNLTHKNRLSPLIARFKFWSSEEKRLSEASKEMASAAAELIRVPDKKAPVSPSAYRKHALELKQEALIAKINAAFIKAVIRKPEFAGDATDVYTINDLRYDERALKRAFHDKDADHLVKFKRSHRGKSQSLTSKEVKAYSISKLSTLFKVA